MIHLAVHSAANAAGTGAVVLFILFFLAIFIGTIAGLSKLQAALRRKQMEIDMRQAAKDADDQERIARKLLAERGL